MEDDDVLIRFFGTIERGHQVLNSMKEDVWINLVGM